MADKYSTKLVLLDASVLEGRYLGPLLRGDPCYDIRTIIDSGYEAGVLQKTLNEVWGHAVLGRGNSRSWIREHREYPKPLDSMIALIDRHVEGAASEQTAWFWFNLAEEWVGQTETLDRIRRDFFDWKAKMKKVCLDVEHALRSAGVKIFSPWLYVSDPQSQADAAFIEKEVGLNSLLPTEDASWMVDAVMIGARGVVTCDRKVINRGRISLGLNLAAPSFVHPSRLRVALDDEFALAVYDKAG